MSPNNEGMYGLRWGRRRIGRRCNRLANSQGKQQHAYRFVLLSRSAQVIATVISDVTNPVETSLFKCVDSVSRESQRKIRPVRTLLLTDSGKNLVLKQRTHSDPRSFGQ
jgi:hypothetical protein